MWLRECKYKTVSMPEADTDRSLPTSMHSMLCSRRWKCIRRSSTTVMTSSEPSLSCGSNAGMLQRNRPRLHWMHTQHAMHPCVQTYPSCCRCSSSLDPSPLLRQRSFFTLKRLKTYLQSSMGDKRLTSLALIHVHAQTTPVEPVEVVDKFALTGPHKLNFLR